MSEKLLINARRYLPCWLVPTAAIFGFIAIYIFYFGLISAMAFAWGLIRIGEAYGAASMLNLLQHGPCVEETSVDWATVKTNTLTACSVIRTSDHETLTGKIIYKDGNNIFLLTNNKSVMLNSNRDVIAQIALCRRPLDNLAGKTCRD